MTSTVVAVAAVVASLFLIAGVFIGARVVRPPTQSKPERTDFRPNVQVVEELLVAVVKAIAASKADNSCTCRERNKDDKQLQPRPRRRR